jgi:hypothetical protein
MAEQQEQDDTGDGRGVWRVVATVAGGALVIMAAWGAWVLHWASCAGHEVPGTFGDAFAPIVGLMTAGALGAAIASVFMQRRELELQRLEMKLQRHEMRDSRKEYVKQAAALTEANGLQARANELAHNAQILEAERQISDVDRVAMEALDAIKAGAPGAWQGSDAGAAWFMYLEANPAQRQTLSFNKPRFQALEHRRQELVQTLERLRRPPASTHPPAAI